MAADSQKINLTLMFYKRVTNNIKGQKWMYDS